MKPSVLRRIGSHLPFRLDFKPQNVMSEKKPLLNRVLSTETAIFALAVGFIGVMHGIAFEDRLVLILYYLAAVGAAYALMRRRAIGLASAVVAVVAATMPIPSASVSVTPDAASNPLIFSTFSNRITKPLWRTKASAPDLAWRSSST